MARLLLARLPEGSVVPDPVVLPTELVIRESA
jgi:DNA-binding LacI/PurR family transcriptional regulator